MASTLVSRYDSHLKNYYYLDSSNGIISFDSPLEVKRSSSSASSTSSKSSFFKKIPKKLNICQRLKSICSHNSDEPQQLQYNSSIVPELHPASAESTYDQVEISPVSLQQDAQSDYTTTNFAQESDVDSLCSIDSYVSSIDDHEVNHNAYQFYNSSTDTEHVSPPTTISTTSCSSNCSGNINHYYYHYCKSVVSKSAHSLTIMNPDEFMIMRGNLDDYNHDEIESLHGAEHHTKLQETANNFNEAGDESYDRLTDSLKLLSVQLYREFNSFEDDDDDDDV